jgi:hypothetical protein
MLFIIPWDSFEIINKFTIITEVKFINYNQSVIFFVYYFCNMQNIKFIYYKNNYLFLGLQYLWQLFIVNFDNL